MRNGFGRCIQPDGSWFMGQWEDSKRHGEGESHKADGTVIIGVWNNDTL